MKFKTGERVIRFDSKGQPETLKIGGRMLIDGRVRYQCYTTEGPAFAIYYDEDQLRRPNHIPLYAGRKVAFLATRGRGPHGFRQEMTIGVIVELWRDVTGKEWAHIDAGETLPFVKSPDEILNLQDLTPAYFTA